ncbi:MAG: chorismate-binding protein [Candidatus Melainabacteria bacterium]|nr:chorismate-binding protein [Candidatus Melainabacteria bacterium]
MNELSVFSLNHEILADLETPVSTFYKLCEDKPHSFLLESVESNEKLGRYSIIGTEPILLFHSKGNETLLENKVTNKITKLENNPFNSLKKLLKDIKTYDKENSSFQGFVGYFGYENIRWIEPRTKLTYSNQAPDVSLIYPGKVVIFDHILHKVNLIANVLLPSGNKTELTTTHSQAKEKLNLLLSDFKKPKQFKLLSLNYENNNEITYTSNIKKENYINTITKAKDYIKNGDIFQVVLSQKLLVQGKHNGFLLYRALRSINPSPYLFYLNYKDFEIAGSSPEVMVKSEKLFQEKNSVKKASLRPIAGTYPRGKNDKEDLNNISKLLSDPKEKAEHLMLVDLARNDLGRVCESGSIKVPELMTIEKYSHVLHIVSQVEGILKQDKTSIDLLCASFPAGTLSGAPKVRAIEIINELEKDQRGPYGGCIGFFGLDDTINTCMTIRTFIVYKDYLEIQVGAGIVADSNPENEYKETLRKGAALFKAIKSLECI